MTSDWSVVSGVLFRVYYKSGDEHFCTARARHHAARIRARESRNARFFEPLLFCLPHLWAHNVSNYTASTVIAEPTFLTYYDNL